MFNLFTDLNTFNKKIETLESKDIGLVPTMGNLHDGHLSLVEASLKDNPKTIVTIFVNPKQFGPNEDFDSYPRSLEQDLDKLKELHSQFDDRELIIFAPSSADEVYIDGYLTTISVGGITNILCGAARPGHFDGVTTVVYQLFKISKASNAYFGQKDYQQVKVVERMSHDLRLDIKLNILPISRDEDGLARSSRNQYMNAQQRELALNLPQTLKRIEETLKENNYINSVPKINEILELSLKDDSWEYLEILDASNLKEVSMQTTQICILGAYRVGKTRLIDNRLVNIDYA